jgi:hypothetical protein
MATNDLSKIAAESYTPDYDAFPSFDQYRAIVSAVEMTLETEIEE